MSRKLQNPERANWEELSTFFKYPRQIRTLIYTTNPIESLNSSIKSLTHNKGVFTTQDALLKIVYLAVESL
jgi:transposase-like protein